MKNKYLLFFFFVFSFPVVAQEQMDLFFDFNKSEINPDSKQKLDSWIAQNKDVEVLKLYGYCDWKGTNKYNDTLSIQRVLAVTGFLAEKKIKIIEGYEIKGFGEDFDQSKVQSENRKVTVFFQKKKRVASVSKQEKTLTQNINTAKVGDIIRLKNIYFKNRSPVFVPKSEPVLYELLCVMEEHPQLRIQIQGHICCQLVSDFEDISTSRARAVYGFLIRHRINRSRLAYKGFGISKPIHSIPEKSEEEANENRRVEILILEN